MLVVSDTSPLTALLKIGRADLLQHLFSEVFIPPAVESELRHNHPILPVWIQVRRPLHIPDRITSAHLDPGETEALALALEIHAGTVLMDERLGRRVARELGLTPTGLLGCLALAKDSGVIAAITPIVADLQTIAGCWFAEPLVADVLRAAGEL